MAGIKFEGLVKLQKKLKKNCKLQEVRTVVRSAGADLQSKAQDNAPVDSGTLKRSITLEIEDGGMTAVVAPHTDYAAYQEYGTRYMAAHPYLEPALEEVAPKFKQKMKELTR